MKTVGNQTGSALVELVMVMTLLVLFGVTTFTLIYSGAGAQERIMEEKDTQISARIALSYINVRLRQNDAKGKVAVERLALTGSDAIIIRERGTEYEYDTWIFWYNGKLMECLVDPGAEPTELDSFTIVETGGLDTEFDDAAGSMTNTVYYRYGDTQKALSSTVYLRSSQGGQP